MSLSARRRVALLVGLVLALAPVARADAPSRQAVAQAGKAASAFVQVKDGSGSAFCVHPSGLFLTNHHVIAGGGDVTLVLNANRAGQRAVKAKVLRSDAAADLALLQAEDVKDLPALEIGNDEKLAEGDEVVACGFPFGKRLAVAREEYPAITITFGRVTALRQKARNLDVIQLDVELHPGNSGGPILGADGKVVGVAVAIIRGTNFRLAIPARKVRRFIETPAITFRPPTPGPADWHKPLPFEVRAVSLLPAAKPFEAELTLRELGGKERKYPMKGDRGVYRTEAPLLTAAAAAEMVRCTLVVSRDGKEVARQGDWIIRESKLPKLYLADMSEAGFRKGPWELGIGTAGRHIKTPIRVAGRESPRGLGTHPPCALRYRLKKGGLLFRAAAGIDDTGRAERGGEITFEVFGDGKLLWSKSLFVRGESAECSVDVSDVETLELRVSAEGNNGGAHAVWLEPYVLSDGSRLRPEPAVALDDQELRLKRLPAAAADVVLGGGGRYLVVAMPRLRRLAVFDVTNPRAVKFIDLGEKGPFLIAAGADKLLVVYPDTKVLERYRLTTLQKEASITLPVEGDKPHAVAMGSASHGPLLVVGERPPLIGTTLFVDVPRMRPLPLELKGNNAAFTGAGTVALASADGRVFAVDGANIFSRGFHSIVVEEDTATVHTSPDHPAYSYPGPDGRLIFTSTGLYTPRLQDPDKGPRHRGALCLPAAQGDLYLRAHDDSFSLYLVGEEAPLLKVTDVGWPGEAAGPQALPPIKRLFLLPAADLIVTIPVAADEVRFQRFDFAKALEKAAGDYLFVEAFAPPPCKKGGRFAYELRTRSKRGGVKYQLASGPEGMTVSEGGKVEWDVPKDFAAGVRDVSVRLRDASGREVTHSFQVRVE
jgi:S1-C subfamily serine protease